ncbi:hypothetical protein LL972_20545 [Xanthomonas campestris pv. asclepiadis]|uniref:hypothetical protein n=1 Tax=Xanthomonas campestris TaxID=339 RepID=UPI001E5BE704|nr:hypothetical protein [Xanthomonas campestris]MCC4618351.1 hypothetical protein [Xanthomonas campestris pv. asclepiadis]
MSAQITEFKIGKAYTTQEVHFTGGLRAFDTQEGWSVFPLPVLNKCASIIFKSPAANLKFVTQCGARMVGMCAKYRNSPDAERIQMEVFEFCARDIKSRLSAAETWEAVSFQAGQAGDEEYSNLAEFICRHLKAAGTSLKNISDSYHDQLQWAIEDGAKVGKWFSNAQLNNIYPNFHSLAAELCSARDHLARVAAIHVGAKSNVNDMMRLESWLNSSTNAGARENPLVALLLAEMGTKDNPGWLRLLGLVRNKMLHSMPMAGDPDYSSITLDEVSTVHGPVRTIRIGRPPSSSSSENFKGDPLIEFSELCLKLENLFRAAWRLAKYPAELPRLSL